MLGMKGEACRNTVGLLLLSRNPNAGRGAKVWRAESASLER
jgi:hypothetical protein